MLAQKGDLVGPKAGVRAAAYSTCIAAAATGVPQRGIVHSTFAAAANIVFPGGLLLSLNAGTAPRMPNGLQLSTPPATFPFPTLRPGMPVLFGARCLHIEACDCSLDLSNCTQWNPQITRPERLDMEIVGKNRTLLANELQCGSEPTGSLPRFNSFASKDVSQMARYLCGRGAGLTPAGDDLLAGWMAIHWLLYGPTPHVIAACQQILAVARQQTHLLSQCWLGYAAKGMVALPIKVLLDAITQEDDRGLETATQKVLEMGATSGYDVIQGMLLGLEMCF